MQINNPARRVDQLNFLLESVRSESFNCSTKKSLPSLQKSIFKVKAPRYCKCRLERRMRNRNKESEIIGY